MELESSTDSEIHKARDKFRLEMAKAAKFAEDLKDPVKAAEIANIPPHLIGRR